MQLSFVVIFLLILINLSESTKILITAVRHGQAEHNLYDGIQAYIGARIRDPHLTEIGKEQALQVQQKIVEFEQTFSKSTGTTVQKHIVAVSPLRRALETSLIAFTNPINPNLEFLVQPDIQEVGKIPCDTGSPQSELQQQFPKFDFSHLPEDWFNTDQKSDWHLSAAVARVKKWINEQQTLGVQHVTLVSHHGFLWKLFGSGYPIQVTLSETSN